MMQDQFQTDILRAVRDIRNQLKRTVPEGDIVDDAKEPVILSRYAPPKAPESETPFTDRISAGGETALEVWALREIDRLTKDNVQLNWRIEMLNIDDKKRTEVIDHLTAELGERNKQLNIEEGRVMTLKAENEELRSITAIDSSGRWNLVEKYTAENEHLKALVKDYESSERAGVVGLKHQFGIAWFPKRWNLHYPGMTV